MKVQLIQFDHPWPNHALMQLSTFHKEKGDQVKFFKGQCDQWGDVSYRSILFKWGKSGLPSWGINGGPGFDPKIGLPDKVRRCRPDYSLYPKNRASWGYTFHHCPRRCDFCVVGDMPANKDKKHYSIWSFHDKKYKKIVLLNNNTFFDPDWRLTFHEVWEAGLSIVDLNGYDARLLDKEKVDYMQRTKWGSPVHFAFDRSQDWEAIEKALSLLRGTKLGRISSFYVMLNYKSDRADGMARIMLIRSYGIRAIALQFNKNDLWSKKVKIWTLNRKAFFGVKFEDFLDTHDLRISRMSEDEKLKYDCETIFRPRGKRLVLKSGGA